jgi:hypothetical protein
MQYTQWTSSLSFLYRRATRSWKTSEYRSTFSPNWPSPQLALLSATVFQEVVKHFETPALSPPYSLSTEGNVDQSMRSNLNTRVNIGVIDEHLSSVYYLQERRCPTELNTDIMRNSKEILWINKYPENRFLVHMHFCSL